MLLEALRGDRPEVRLVLLAARPVAHLEVPLEVPLEALPAQAPQEWPVRPVVRLGALPAVLLVGPPVVPREARLEDHPAARPVRPLEQVPPEAPLEALLALVPQVRAVISL